MFFRKISETSTLSTLTSSWPSKVTYTYSTSNTFQQTLLPLCTQKVHYIVGTLIRDSDYKLLSGAHTFGKVQHTAELHGRRGREGAKWRVWTRSRPRFSTSTTATYFKIPTRSCCPTRPQRGNKKDFFRNFAASMIKMGKISPLTGIDGEARKDCRWVNSRGY
jgi:hypothetical protein